ncbi:MAG: hypothetical protein VB104_02645 [Candidatus Limiplasma sp.]|nr:hypothetical protein [Candidatus Limiplasma sp.]
MKKSYLWYRLLDNLPVIGGAIVIIAVLALFVAGIVVAINGIPVLAEGTVADMSFTEARTDIQFYTTTDSKGHVTMRSQPVHYPNKWSIQVVGARENGEPRSEWWEVGEGMYGQIGIGDMVRRDAKLGVVSIVRKAVAEDADRNP